MTAVPPWERERLAAPPPPMTLRQAMRDDPAVVAAQALALGAALLLVGSLLAGLRANLGGVDGVSSQVASGYRLRLLAVFDAARLEVAVAPLVGVGLLGVSRALVGRMAVNLRRPALVLLGAIGAYVAFGALVRTVVLFSLLGRGEGNLFGATIQAFAALPVAVAATVWCAGLLSGDAGYRPPEPPEPEDQPSS